jgi:hypothetical protein
MLRASGNCGGPRGDRRLKYVPSGLFGQAGALLMTIEEFVAEIEDKLPPAPGRQLSAFESQIGHRLPEDYRHGS